jgi:hypothetical protein
MCYVAVQQTIGQFNFRGVRPRIDESRVRNSDLVLLDLSSEVAVFLIQRSPFFARSMPGFTRCMYDVS